MPRRRRPPRAGALTELPPLRILAQMASLQALFYAAALVLTLFTTLVAGQSFSSDLVLGWSAVRGDTTQGWMMAFLWVLDGGLFMSLAIVILIARSKLVLDFALSMHAIHLVVVVLYSGQVPRNLMWWAAMAASSAASVGLGTWGCQYRELRRPITFGGIGGGSRPANGSPSGPAEGSGSGGPSGGGVGDGVDGDEEQGFSRGRGRGRGRDGGGDYEMVQMPGDENR